MQCLGSVYLSYPPLLATIFVSGKAESTPCSRPTKVIDNAGGRKNSPSPSGCDWKSATLRCSSLI